jgi:hypothetical protein
VSGIVPTPTPERTAIVYDFDGTLARGNIQEHSFLPKLGISKKKFWKKVGALAKKHDSDPILIYMWRMLESARKADERVTRKSLKKHGAGLPLFKGVPGWFDRINSHAQERGLMLEHYVVSSGNHEIIRGSKIFHRFEKVYASRFIYDAEGNAIWPGMAINYTTKTQFLFRINKGIRNSWNSRDINRWMPMHERPVPFSRMIFIGDGETDIPAMKTVRGQGGHSIAVFDPKAWKRKGTRAQERIFRLISEDRVHYVAPADYREGSQLDITVKGILGRIAEG